MTAPGPLLATGRTAEVFAWEPGFVLKLYNLGWTYSAVQHEQRIVRYLMTVGLPVPAVGEIVEVGDRFGLVYERVDGPTLSEVAQSDAGTWEGHGRLLAELHAAVHNVAAPPLLPGGRERLYQRIAFADLPEQHRTLAVKMLDSLPAGDRLCHGDLHPLNVIVGAAGPVIIDWIDAVCGHPLADVARTLLILDLSLYSPAVQELNLTAKVMAARDGYLARYFELQPGGEEDLHRWRPVIAAARIAEDIEDEREFTLARILR